MSISDKHINNAVRSFGIDAVLTTLNLVAAQYDAPWVSVGCGNAALESLVNVKWYLVDPDPLCYASIGLEQPYADVDFSSVAQLVEQHPSLVWNSVLFLNWPTPNDSTYDYDAIAMLKPLAVVATTELFGRGNGAAGGKAFHEWRQSKAYKLVYEASLDQSGTELDIRLSWWQNRQLAPIETTIVPQKRILCQPMVMIRESCPIQ